MAPPEKKSASVIARAVVSNAAREISARSAFASNALRAATPLPRGMGRGRGLFVGRHDTLDPVTVNRIPVKRAVRVGKQWFNSRGLRSLLAHNPRATNPLTREPLPSAVHALYGPKTRKPQARGPAPRRVRPEADVPMNMLRSEVDTWMEDVPMNMVRSEVDTWVEDVPMNMLRSDNFRDRRRTIDSAMHYYY